MPYLNRFNRRIKASSLGYAISFMLLIALMTSGFLFIASTNNRLQASINSRVHVLFDNKLGLNYGTEIVPGEYKEIIHISGDTTEVKKIKWGVYEAINVYTYHGNLSTEKNAISSPLSTESFPTVFTPNNKSNLKVCGNTLIEGNIETTDRGVERGYVAGRSYEREELYNGSLKVSEKEMPAIDFHREHYQYDSLIKWTKPIENLVDTNLSFREKTSLFSSLKPIILNNQIRGNLIIHSFDSIFVKASSDLKHIILVAPKIRFEKGFKGVVQAFAEESITCEDSVELNYPSACVLIRDKVNPEEANFIKLSVGSMVLGGVLLWEEAPQKRNELELIIEEAIVGGLIYNVGVTEVKGKIIGSIYTNSFLLRLGGGIYKNFLLDVLISSKQLPDQFIYPNWIGSNDSMISSILACY